MPDRLFDTNVDIKDRTAHALERGNLLMDDLGLQEVTL